MLTAKGRQHALTQEMANESARKLLEQFPNLRANDECLRRQTQRGIDQAKAVDELRAKQVQTPEQYGVVRAIELISSACRVADGFADRGRAEIAHMKARSEREGVKISAESVAEVQRHIARHEATSAAIGLAMGFLNQRAAELRRTELLSQ